MLSIHRKCLSLEDINKLLFDLSKSLEQENISESNLFKIKLIYEELLLNCWYHGYDQDNDNTLSFEIKVQNKDSHIELSLIDNTSKFDYDKAFKKTEADSIGGHGINLVENFCDKWTYTRSGKYNINYLEITL
ncbi:MULTISPECIES: ATP-binding protein [unclassified Francisella]|uniref:ATP-binding protein n=1 Tax=unclassified Francisella TaxID=2610885 RepID=UPI002E307DB8|nr:MULTISPECIES: ATP-binding protein [unclassified Francisella]MED7818400.1 ATP-binding protein [Francisella sp. 19S2-4]MED7829236.1 ATP-binding protein [Francisella sp. 19S2-10]